MYVRCADATVLTPNNQNLPCMQQFISTGSAVGGTRTQGAKQCAKYLPCPCVLDIGPRCSLGFVTLYGGDLGINHPLPFPSRLRGWGAAHTYLRSSKPSHHALMATPDDFLAFAFPDSILNGSITDTAGGMLYTLTSEDRKFRSDTTTISRPDASTVAVIRWGSIIELKRRSVILADAIVPAKEYLAEGKADSLGGANSHVFQDLEGNAYYWKNQEVSRVMIRRGSF